MDHQFWPYYLIKCFWSQETQGYRGLFECGPLFMGLLRTFRNIYQPKGQSLSTLDVNSPTVITQMAVEDSGQHQRLIK